jgi:hypothetical protein
MADDGTAHSPAADIQAVIAHNDSLHAERAPYHFCRLILRSIRSITEHPCCLWNIVNAEPEARDPDNRILANSSKGDLQSLEFLTDLPLAVPDGEPRVHAFDMAEHVKVGDVVAYEDVH